MNHTRTDLPWEGVYVLVDDARPPGRLGAFIGDRKIGADDDLRMVHVMSTHAGGEIRGYVLHDAKLHLRLPCYTGVWQEMDDAVATALSASVVPYHFPAGCGGMACEVR